MIPLRKQKVREGKRNAAWWECFLSGMCRNAEREMFMTATSHNA